MKVLFVVLLSMFVASVLAEGTLYVDEIQGNLVNGAGVVRIEDNIIDGETLQTTFISALDEDDGVSVEETVFSNGDVYVPANLAVDGDAYVWGLLVANGGISADSDIYPSGTSFSVEDETGDTVVNGTLFPNGGINADDGKFTVNGETGETVIQDGLLRPNGGINVNDGKFIVDSATGTVSTEGDVLVSGDLVFGAANAANHKIRRVASTQRVGGDTYIQAQDATDRGGNLVISPGCGSSGADSCGQILFGRQQADNIIIGRPEAVGNVNGGTTTFEGQSSNSGDGGDFIVKGGSSESDGAGNLILSPGSGGAGLGQIILGNPEFGDDDNDQEDLVIRRPTVDDDDNFWVAGSTTIQGQSATNGDGGDLRISAGNSVFGDGGNLHLEPGRSSDGSYGEIILGDFTTADIVVTRYPVSADAGDTIFAGQSSVDGDGGDIVFVSGDSADSVAGSIFLTTGVSGIAAGAFGEIIVGNDIDPLLITRPDTAGDATPTSIVGQGSLSGTGGDLTIEGGFGADLGGDVNIFAGTSGVDIGDVNVEGNNINFSAEESINIGGFGAGADIALYSQGGNIRVRYADVFAVAGEVAIINGRVILQGGECEDGTVDGSCDGVSALKLEADPSSILAFKDHDGGYQTLLTSRQDMTVPLLFVDNTPVAVTFSNAVSIVESLRQGFYRLISALGPCGHGLFSYVDLNGNIIGADDDLCLELDGSNSRRGLNSGFDYNPYADQFEALQDDSDVLDPN